MHAGCHPRVTISSLRGKNQEQFQTPPTGVLPVINTHGASPVANGTWDPVGTLMFDLTYTKDVEIKWDVHFTLVNPKDESQAPDTVNVYAVMTVNPRALNPRALHPQPQSPNPRALHPNGKP